MAAERELAAAATERETARGLGEAVEDEADRRVFLSELERGPWFGLD